jgi:thioredoxin-related protein
VPALSTLLLLAIGCSQEADDPLPTPPITNEPAPETAMVETAMVETATADAPAAVDPMPEGEPPETARPYDESANADAQIRAAVARAQAGNKRVLLMFGANWCVWCRRLDWVFENHRQVRASLDRHFEVVHVDTGGRGSGTNAAIVERYGDPTQHGLPVLVVLDGTGAQVATQETGALEDGDHHDPVRVLAFLDRVKGSET